MSKLTEGTGFHQPENYDCSQEGSGWRFWEGANDWEHATTWMWVVFPGDSQNKRVWVEINYEGHGNPDDGEVRYDGPEAKEAKAWGKKAVAAWLRIAKRLHGEKRENESTRQWIDAFKDALKDKEMTPFVKSHGSDATKWEPVKESLSLAAKLLEDEEVDGLLDRSKTGFCITATSKQTGNTLYLAHRSWAGDQPWRFSSYEEDKFLFANAVEAEKVLPLARKQRPDAVLQVVITSPENKLPTKDTVALESEEADDFIERIDQSSEHGFYVTCEGCYNPHSPEAGQTSGRVNVWYWADSDDLPTGGRWLLNKERASKYDTLALAMHVQHLLQDEHPEYKVEIKTAVQENEEADDFLARMDSKAQDRLCYIAWGKDAHRYYVRYTPRQTDWWMKSTLVVLPEQATKLPFSKAVELMGRLRFKKGGAESEDTSGFEIVPCDVEAQNIAAYRQRCQGTQESLTEAVYKRSSCQINAPDDIKDFLIQWGMLNIPEEKLYIDADGGCGREDEPHVTVRYGLDFAEPPEEFHRLITTWKAFPIRLAGVSLFKNDKFDVVKMDVISEDLIRLNAEIRRQFPSQVPDKFPDYHPHLTIAYVQKGAADQLEGADPFKESMDVAPEFQAERLRFSGAGDTEKGDRVIQFIPFDKSKSNEERRAEEIVAEALDADDEADEFLGRFGRFVIAMIAPQGYHAAPVYLEPDGTYHYMVDSARVFLTRNEAEEELARQRPLTDEEYTLKVVALPDAKKVKPFGPAPSDFGESHEEVDDVLSRARFRYYQIEKKALTREWLGAGAHRGGSLRFTSNMGQAGIYTHAQATQLLQQIPEPDRSKCRLVPASRDLELTQESDEDVTDLLGRMEPRRYALRFNIRNPRYVGSVMIKPPWWDGHYWGAQGYVKTLAEAEDHPTFGHAWDARVSLAEQLNLKVQDIEIVTHIGAKLIAVDAWPSTRGNGNVKESEADEFLDRVQCSYMIEWRDRFGDDPKYWKGASIPFWTIRREAAAVYASKEEAEADLAKIPLHAPPAKVVVANLRESEEADDYVARMEPCVLANVPPADADAFTVYLAEDGSWSGIREAYVFLNRAEAAIPLKKWQAHFEQKYGQKEDLRVLGFEQELRKWGLNQQTVRESVEDEVDDFLDRQGFLVQHNAFAGQWTYWCDKMGGWGPKEMATRYSREEAEQKVRDLSRHQHLMGLRPVAASSLQAESDADIDPKDYIDNMTFGYAIVYGPEHELFYWSSGRDGMIWTRKPSFVHVFKTQEEAEEHRRKYVIPRYPNRAPDQFRVQPIDRMAESANPFGPINFPVDATEVLTKIRARRNKRGAPAWF